MSKPFRISLTALVLACILSVWKFLPHAPRPVDRVELLFRNLVVTANQTMRGNQHPATLDALEILASRYSQLEMYSEAMPLDEQIVATRKRVLGVKNPVTVEAMSNLAMTYSKLGKHLKALTLEQEILNIQEEILGTEHSDTAHALMNLAVTHTDLGKYDSALLLEQRALKIFEKVFGPDHPETANALNNLSATYCKLGQPRTALPLIERALQIRESVLGVDHLDTAEAFNNLAATYSALGYYEQALSRAEMASVIFEKIVGPDHPKTVQSLINLAAIYGELGKYAKELPLELRALEVGEKNLGKGHPNTTQVLINLATTYSQLGEYTKALSMAERALHIRERSLGEAHPNTANALIAVASAYGALGEYAKALPLERRAAKIRENSLGANHPDTANAFINLAATYSATDDYATAALLEKKALQVFEETLGPDHPDVAHALLNLAQTRRELKEEELAFHLELRALAIREKALGPEHPLTALARARVGEHLFRTGYHVAGLALAKMAVNSIQKSRFAVHFFGRDSTRAYSAKLQFLYQDLADRLASEGRIAEAQTALEMLKAQEFLGFTRGTIPLESKQRIELTDEESKWRAWYLSIIHRNNFIELLSNPAKWRLIGSAQEKRTERPTVLAQTQSLEKLVSSISADAALAQYYVTEGRVGIIVTTPRGEKVYTVPIKEKQLRKIVIKWLGQLRSPRADPRALSKYLYEILLAPLWEDVSDAGITTLMVAPSGVLRYLPYSALHNGTDYLVTQVDMPVFTGIDRERLVEPDSAAWKAAGFGATRGFDGFPPLPAVRQELEQIIGSKGSAILPGKIFLDEEFTAAELRRLSRQGFPVMHVASHFRFSPGTEMNSYLLLGDGERLSLGQIREQGLRFDGVDLLTLSACETAVGWGEDAQGQEIEGFATLAQKLGAKAVLASLWKVADQSTAQLMVETYRGHQRDGASKIAALRQAQLALLNSAKYSHPYYWAPFVLMGNWK